MEKQINVPVILEQFKQIGDLFLTDFKKDPIPQDGGTFSLLFSTIEQKSIALIKSGLAIEFPNTPWIEDEFDMDGQKHGSSLPEYWLFDSMDGAVQYLQHLPGWAFNLVLVRNGKPYFAAVYNPLGNELFWAVEGKGAFLNNDPISPSKKTDPSLMLATFNHPPYQNKFEGLNKVIGKSLEKLLGTFGAVRNYGPLGLMLCSLAAGRIDVYYQFGLDTYNWLAGILIAKEAGALILTANGSEWNWGAESLLVTAQSLPKNFLLIQTFLSSINRNLMTHTNHQLNNDKETLIAIVKEMTESFSGAKSTQHWTGDALWFDIPPFASKGIEPAIQMFDKVFGSMKSIKIDILKTEVTLGDYMGIVCTIQKAEVIFKDNKSKAMLIRETDCFKKVNGEWKLFHQHASVPAGGEWDGKIISE